ncbi:hypothetical protein BG004_002180 [Podila humilis]|nr:hypothetical protein BG004_002180 [Podila humilis]
MSSAEYFLPLRGSTSNLAQPSATTEVGTGAVIGGKPSPPAGGSSDSGERKIDHLPWHLKRASVAIPEGTAPVRLWRDDAAAGLDRSTTTSTSTPLTSATLTCGLDTGIEAEEEKIKAVRDGAAVFEGRSVSRRPSQDGELTLKKRCSKDNDSLVPAASTYPQHQPQYQQQRLARKWPGGGQIAVVDLVSGSDQQCSEDDEDVEAVMVRLPSLRGCLLEDGDDHQQHSSRDEQMSNVINDLHHQHHHYHHEQQRPYPELLEQYQMPKVVKRVPKNSYLDDYQQQQEQKANKQRHSMMGIGGGAIGLGKKLSGKIRNSMFAPSVSSSSPLPSAMAPITDVVTNVDKQGIDGGVKDTT